MFRVRAELTSLSAGVGKKRIVLPEGWAITTDVVALFFISLPIFRFVIAPIPTIIINKIIGASNDQNLTIWAMAIIASFSLAIMLHKKDPAGKTSLQYMWSIIHFYLRNSWHDGWSTKRISLSKEKNNILFVSRYEDGNCGAMPAKGYNIKKFILHRPTAVKVRKNKIEFSRRGKRIPAGKYQIENGKVVIQPEKKKIPSW